ncbi:MAG: GH3 auxin-responsive promoter family protein [Deltaproteobacteria bacterium]|nr:GH3 auxin-responsive promoter family protein [Deltaproteobacteria bacterium]
MINSRLGHTLIKLSAKSDYILFKANSLSLKESQLAILGKVLGCKKSGLISYSDFQSKYPVTTYSDYLTKIDNHKQALSIEFKNFLRFQPTSGSTEKIKWIPYTKEFINEFNRALNPWIYDLYSRYPEIKNGKHYWALSWLPNEFRNKNIVLDDSELFSFWKKHLLKSTFAINQRVDLALSLEDSLLATLVYLVNARDLCLLSVWSPIFLTELIEFLTLHKETVSKILSKGRWEELNFHKKVKCPFNPKQGKILKEIFSSDLKNNLSKLWPNLKLISCWTTGSSKKLFPKLTTLFPTTTIQGKGLWATEGVVTIPFENKYPLAYLSHFYEFRELDSDNILPSWDLKKGQIVEPILTSSNSFYRYKLGDILKVVDSYNSVPCFEFIERFKTIDLVGEKLSFQILKEIIENIESDFGIANSFFSIKQEANEYQYVYFFESPKVQGNSNDLLEKKIEDMLSENYHYALARQLFQLKRLKTIKIDNIVNKLVKIRKSNVLLGNLKLEPYISLNEVEFEKICF